MKKSGTLIISLDFELAWGIRDMPDFDKSKKNIQGAISSLKRMLQLFDQYNIKVTLAVVGFLLHKNKKELEISIPTHQPSYRDKNLSPYSSYIHQSVTYSQRELHFCPEFIQYINENCKHEIGSHTYSHYYCLEEGQSLEEFEQDLILFKEQARSKGIQAQSIIFPRNQYNKDYLEICLKHGITSFRGNENSWFNQPVAFSKLSLFTRVSRLLDSYIRISNSTSYSIKEVSKEKPYNLKASRFLRPYSKYLSIFDNWKLKRIKNEMTIAAKNGKIYHLWWHPHNFGINQEKNFDFLNKLLNHYLQLHKKYNFSSATMNEISQKMELNDI